jgi:hypothetical protein
MSRVMRIPRTRRRRVHRAGAAGRAVALAVVMLAATACGSGDPETPAGGPGTFTGPSAAPDVQPTFADLTSGDAATVAILQSFNADALSAVVEPTIMMTGEEYCTRYRTSGSGDICAQPWTTIDSRTKVTLPVSADATFASIGDGRPDCVDSELGSGARCAATLEQFAEWANNNSNPLVRSEAKLVRVEIKNGVAVRLAEVHTP